VKSKILGTTSPKKAVAAAVAGHVDEKGNPIIPAKKARTPRKPKTPNEPKVSPVKDGGVKKPRTPAKKKTIKEEHLVQAVEELTTRDEPEKTVSKDQAPATLNDLESNHFEEAFGLGDVDIKDEDEGAYGVYDMQMEPVV
jgi:hypothetical protein